MESKEKEENSDTSDTDVKDSFKFLINEFSNLNAKYINMLFVTNGGAAIALIALTGQLLNIKQARLAIVASDHAFLFLWGVIAVIAAVAIQMTKISIVIFLQEYLKIVPEILQAKLYKCIQGTLTFFRVCAFAGAFIIIIYGSLSLRSSVGEIITVLIEQVVIEKATSN